jgi:hypothetical protein
MNAVPILDARTMQHRRACEPTRTIVDAEYLEVVGVRA